MLTVRYRKTGPGAFLSHLDVMRHITRTIRRAELAVGYSEGFNPHMLLFATPPLPLGAESVSEYFTVAAKDAAAEFLPRFNAAAPDWLKGVRAFETAKNPNVAGKSDSAEYRIALQGLSSHETEVLEILNGDTFLIEYFGKDGQISKNVREQILSLRFEGEALIAVLSAGNVNLRADRFAYNLARLYDLRADTLRIVKRRHFLRDAAGTVLDADDYLSAPEEVK